MHGASGLAHGLVQPGPYEAREAHGVRALLSTRKALLKKTMDLANEVRGLLKIFGIRLPRTVNHGSFDGIVRPLIERDEVLAHALVPLLDARVVLYQHFLELDRRVKRAATRDEVCMRMMTVPGVGPIAALTFKSAVDDPSRFRRSRTVVAHFGLTPGRYQSGEADNPGRISKAGDSDVRATLYAAANALLMRTMAGSQIKTWGMRLIRTKGRRRAVVAVARKLAVLLHRMWTDGTEFRPADRKRARPALSLAEREEISRGLSVRRSLRAIARQLGRAPSMICREVQRNGGQAAYRATASDQAA